LAEKYGVSMAQISLAWLLSKEVVSAPIVGVTSLEKLADIIGMYRWLTCAFLRADAAAGAVYVKLGEEEIKALEAPYKPVAISGHIWVFTLWVLPVSSLHMYLIIRWAYRCNELHRVTL
jgi:hypothetical protein